MSQWNNSYSYNQYQGANAWNNDLNGQYSNHQYYSNRPEQANQYVGFNEFLSQIQPSGSVPNTSTYNNAQYENYSSGQYRYQNVHSTPQNAQVDSFKYSTNQPNASNGVEMYQANAQNQYSAVDSNVYTNDMILKSNLHPTATEFVPKNYMAQPSISSHAATNSQNIPETPTVSNTKELSSNQIRNENINQYRNSHNNTNMKSRDSVLETRTNQGSSSDTNWRERPQNTKQNKENRSQDSYRNQDSTRRDISHWNESSSRDRDSQQYETKRHYDPNDYTYGQNDEASSSNSTRNYESNRFDNRNDKRGQKGNSKVKNKDTERMFYNSSIVKDSQDVRSGRGEPRESSGRNRNWVGSQRLRAAERNNMEDEQYASSYFNNRDERNERVMKSESTQSPARNRNRQADQGNKEMTQRERLTEQLDKGTLECLVCCERVKQIDPVWSCSNCYHVLHLRCIRKWAMSSIVNSNWRCPACQNTNADIPTEYRCMCGAVRSPEYQRGSTGAHTCGKSCKRPRQCPHPCMLLCHPGPCPPCQATVNKQCGCGAETRSVLCSSKLPQVCGRVCNRTLECRVHKCKKECHEGPCDPCTEIVTQVCHCPAAKCREVECTMESGACASWSCGGTCGRVLACGAHVCRDECHPPPCNPCKLLPETVITCPCGKTRVLILDREKRKSCMDPIPLCGNICAKPLECGPAGDRHFCKIDCHQGPCPVCPDKTVLQCRCGHSSRDVPCADLREMYNNVFCQKKCNKKLSCGRHRCRTACCVCASHRCALTCGRTLSCQTHRCEEFCHTGHCAPCPIVSFEELSCECGAEVLLPPVRCGTKPPPCTAPCRRERPCGHPPHHSCHSGDCPPCLVLTTKRCHGGHEERKTIPCSQEEFSCGLPCGKPLPCGKHTCIKTCHKGPCDTSKCTQPCNEKRASCGHPCAAPCHSGGAEASACPSTTSCRRLVRATCPCKRRQAERPCCENARDYAKMMSALAATKMHDGGSVDLSDVQCPGSMLKTLECDDECRVEARTRQLALALQIRNPDVSAKLAPRYSEHVRATAAKEPAFAQQTHDKLTELVHLAKKSKQKTRSHSFPSMNWQKRQFIHELCEHFGCESVAYDAEPNRNVVATADKEKSWLPAMSILEVLSREAGKRRVPGPVLRASNSSTPLSSSSATSSSTSSATKSASGWATLTSTNAWAARSQAKQQQAEKKIDYFDNPPEN